MKRKNVMTVALAGSLMVSAVSAYSAITAEAKPERAAVAVKAEAKPERMKADARIFSLAPSMPELPEVPFV